MGPILGARKVNQTPTPRAREKVRYIHPDENRYLGSFLASRFWLCEVVLEGCNSAVVAGVIPVELVSVFEVVVVICHFFDEAIGP